MDESSFCSKSWMIYSEILQYLNLEMDARDVT